MTTARDIVLFALKSLNYYPSDGSPEAADVADGLTMFNRMVAGFAIDGLIIGYPANVTWREDWRYPVTYAAGDAVATNGQTYTCTAPVTSTLDDEPGRSANWRLYWTLTPYVPLTLDKTIPFDFADEDGLIAMLVVRLSPLFNAQLSQPQATAALDGWRRLQAKYIQTPDAVFDPGLTRTATRRLDGSALTYNINTG